MQRKIFCKDRIKTFDGSLLNCSRDTVGGSEPLIVKCMRKNHNIQYTGCSNGSPSLKEPTFHKGTLALVT